MPLGPRLECNMLSFGFMGFDYVGFDYVGFDDVKILFQK